MSHTFSLEALGTVWYVEIFAEVDENMAARLSETSSHLLSDIEARFSRFRPDSLTSQLNTTGVVVTTDPDWRALITFGQQMYLDTGGLFNFLAGETLSARGYDPTYRFTPTKETPLPANPLTDLVIENNRYTLLSGGVDFGGYGKGWAIDRLFNHLQSLGYEYVLVNGGGDMRATSDHGEAITIYLEDPLQPGQFLGQTTLCNQGFAASSPHKRAWKHANTTYHHVVGNVLADASFVVAPSALLADVYATTALLSLTDTPPHAVGIARYHAETKRMTITSPFTLLPAYR